MVLASLTGETRAHDGLLHASSHLTTPLRHVQLELSGAEQCPLTINELITFETGHLWHRKLEGMFRDLQIPFMSEVDLTEWMPEGWGGRADWIAWSKKDKAFVLGDLKTIAGAGLPWVIREGAKEAHLWQLSSYWFALRDMGLPLLEGFAIAYLPKDGNLSIQVLDCAMVEESLLHATMAHRKTQVAEYLLNPDPKNLAPIPPREEKRIWNAKTKQLDLVLKPHYSSMYCRFVNCGCGDESQEKQGHWIRDEFGAKQYVPRKGFDTPEKLIVPYDKEFRS